MSAVGKGIWLSAVIWLAPVGYISAREWHTVCLNDFARDCEGWVVQEPPGSTFSRVSRGRFSRGAFSAVFEFHSDAGEAVLLKTFRPPLDLTGQSSGSLVELFAWIYLPPCAAEWDLVFGVYCDEDWKWGAADEQGLLPGWHRITLPVESIPDPADVRQLKIILRGQPSTPCEVLLDRVCAIFTPEKEQTQ